MQCLATFYVMELHSHYSTKSCPASPKLDGFATPPPSYATAILLAAPAVYL